MLLTVVRALLRREGVRVDGVVEVLAVLLNGASMTDGYGSVEKTAVPTFRNFCDRNFLSYSIISSLVTLKLGQ